MNERPHLVTFERTDLEAPIDRGAEPAPLPRDKVGRRLRGWLLGATAMLLLAGGLGYGGWQDYAQRQQVAVTAQQQRDFVPDVMVGQVSASGATVEVTLPGTTFAYEVANIYARANGYIQKRNVDIGDRVKASDVLAELTAPELD